MLNKGTFFSFTNKFRLTQDGMPPHREHLTLVTIQSNSNRSTLMRRIKVIEANQGIGLTRVQDKAWQHLLKFEDGYFEQQGDVFDFYTSDGLLTRAIRNSEDFMAKRFTRNSNDLFVDHCEPGLGYSIIEINSENSNQFLFRDTGFYNSVGKSFFIKFHLMEQGDDNNVPDIWGFEATYNLSDIEALIEFLQTSKIVKPNPGELLIKTKEDTASARVIFKGKYFRRLIEQLKKLSKTDVFSKDKRWYSIFFGLRGSVNPTVDFNEFDELSLSH
jgi:hypothetical protein